MHEQEGIRINSVFSVSSGYHYGTFGFQIPMSISLYIAMVCYHHVKYESHLLEYLPTSIGGKMMRFSSRSNSLLSVVGVVCVGITLKNTKFEKGGKKKSLRRYTLTREV